MFKILVTTKHSHEGASVHTLVIDFSSSDEAITAVDIINRHTNHAIMHQSALLLFSKEDL